MAEDKSVVKPVEAPALKPVAVKPLLAPTPVGKPRYASEVKNAKGETVVLGDPRATRALVALMDVHAVNGGAACHWGGPAALAELMASIHGIMFAVKNRPWFDAYNFVNDAGHTENGVYALRANYGFDKMTFEDLKGFRSIESKLTGHGESHLNPEGVYLSNGPLGSAVSQAQGLAQADKLTGLDRVTICVVSDGAAMEGEAKEAFAAIPGLAAKGRVNPFVLVVSDNDTKLSGRITKDSFSMQPTFEAMDDLGWNVIKLEQGNDLQQAYLAVEKAIAAAQADPTKPVCLWAKTIKGFGVKSTVESSSGGHGFPLANGEKIVEFVDEIYGGQTPDEFKKWAQSLRQEWEASQAKKAAAPASAAPAVKKDKIQAGLAKGAIQAAQAGYPVYSISADLAGSTGMSTFQKSFPDRFVEVGVAESNMVSVAAGFSKQGYVPIVDTFAQFGVTKGNLPLTMAVLSQAPVIAVFSHAGFQDAADGASHQATAYVAAVSAIPDTVVICPCCSDEAEALMLAAVKHVAEAKKSGGHGENIIFFVGRESYPVNLVEGSACAWGKAHVLQGGGTDVTLVATGPLVGEALAAGKKLAELGVKATVIHNPFVNRPDLATIGAAVKASGGRLVTLEDHQIVGGMGAQLVHALADAGIPVRSKTLGMKGTFGQSAYLAKQLYDKYGMNAASMVEAAQALLK
jgi:transketolase